MHSQCLFLLFMLLNSVFAHALTPEHVPEPLKPWLSWVEIEQPDKNCPFFYQDYQQKQCAMPSQLRLNLHDKGGTFSAQWQVYQNTWLALAGDSNHWPQKVQLNQKPALVMDRDGEPSVRVESGQYTLTGEFYWDSLPDSLHLPENTALLQLQINGKTAPVNFKNGELWLNPKDDDALDQQNRLSLRVFRKIEDDIPLRVTTRIVLTVSGEAREERLDSVLLPDLIPLAVQSALPAQLDDDGALRVQVRAGQWQIDVQARSQADLSELRLTKLISAPTSEAPTQAELWVFQAQANLRLVDITQVTAISASQSDLPEEWQALPAYRVEAGQAMGFKVIRRGNPNPEPNRLQLKRTLWLDFDGSAYTVNDVINGTMIHDWRLTALPSLQLGRVALNEVNQVITLEPNGKGQGVEVRNGQIALNADSRLQGDIARINAVGWKQNFYRVTAELNLPAGWQLLAVTGVDNVPNTWLARWTLLDLFLVLLTSLAIARLWNYYWASLAGVTLVLIWHEPDAPHYLWCHVLFAIALLRVIPEENRFAQFIRWYRNGCYLSLVLIALPFMLNQVRFGMYPHLAHSENAEQFITPSAPASVALSSAPVYDLLKAGKRSAYMAKDKILAEESMTDSIDPQAKVQTGPGLPQWQWHKVFLSWNGAVNAEQSVRFWYLSPPLTLVLNFLRVILISVLMALLFNVRAWRLPQGMTLASLVWLIVPLVCFKPAHAEFPSETLLQQLKERLTQAQPDCLPYCADIPQAQLQIDANILQITLQIHAQEPVFLPLPAQAEQWFPNEVFDNQQSARALYRQADGLAIALNAGTHHIVLRGAVSGLRKFTLNLPLKPKQIQLLNASAWQVLGIHENGIADDSLQFERVANSQTTETALNNQSLPSLVRITRTLHLGLNWRVETQLTRLSPSDSAIVLAVPLLTGEAVTSANVRVEQGAVQIHLSAQQNEFFWQSSLKKTAQLQLTAPDTREWVEVWQVDVSPLWHLEASGIPMVYNEALQQGLLEWRPWAKEQLLLQLTRPTASQDKTITIDQSHLQFTQGERTREVNLTAVIRSSQANQLTLTLPDTAILQTVRLNGQNQLIRLEKQKLLVPLVPNVQTLEVLWQEPQGISSIMSSSLVNIGQESVNNTISLRLSADRWLLFTQGSAFGPVVLFWSVLIILSIIAFALGKVSLTPLRTRHWFLLLMGLSQIPIFWAGIVIVWLMLFGWRERQTSQLRYFNGLQVGLGLMTIFALSALFSAVAQGLLSTPNMHIVGNHSNSALLNWYSDRSSAQLPQVTIFSLPIGVYRLLMLAWSLWLAMSLLNWLRWLWQCFSRDGLWYKTVESNERNQ